MTILRVAILLILFEMLCLNALAIELDSIKLIRGKWILINDSIDTSIGNEINAESYDGKMWLSDTLIFKKKKFCSINNCIKIIDFDRVFGTYIIKMDTLILETYTSYKSFYKINKLSENELIIEETMSNDSIGVFRLIGYYRKE